MLDASFINGLVVGVVGSAVVGLVTRQVMFAVRSVRGFFQPPVVVQRTPPSPAQAAMGCVRGLMFLGLFAAIAVGVLVVVLSGPVQSLLQR